MVGKRRQMSCGVPEPVNRFVILYAGYPDHAWNHFTLPVLLPLRIRHTHNPDAAIAIVPSHGRVGAPEIYDQRQGRLLRGPQIYG